MNTRILILIPCFCLLPSTAGTAAQSSPQQGTGFIIGPGARGGVAPAQPPTRAQVPAFAPLPSPAPIAPSVLAPPAFALPAPVPAADFTPEARLALTAPMPLDHRRFLLHLYAQLGQVDIAERLAARVLAEAPGDRAAQLTLASMYLDQKQTAKALALSQRLAQLYPGDPEALYHLGAAYHQAGQYDQAAEVLRALKRDKFDRKLFPHQGDLASAALNAGDWPGAQEAYRELLANHPLSDDVRSQARSVLERLYREHLPQLTVEAVGANVGSGELLRTRVDFRRHLTDRNKIFFTAGREDTHVKAAPGLRERRAANMDGVVGLETTWNTNWTTAVFVGGNGATPQGGASVARRLGDRGELKLEGYYAERATDGLLLESLDGRQNRLSLSAQYLLTSRWNIYGTAIGREVTVERHQTGRGYGGLWGLEHIFLNGAPDLRIGYRGAALNYSSRTSDTTIVDPAASATATLADKAGLLGNLVLPHFHREGGYLNWSDRLGSAFGYQLGAGVDYAFDRSSIEYNALGGFTFYPVRRMELRTNLGYSSSARTSDAGSDQWEISVALRWWF